MATPVFNTIIRTQEIEADRFGLNLARDPHRFAEVMLKPPRPRRHALAGGNGQALT